jgi:CRISPR-associated protein Csm5
MAQIEEVIKNSKKIIGEKIPCSIEVLTPVHIGSGTKLTERIDFIKTEQSVQIVSQSELMQYLENNPDELNRFINGNYNLDSLKKIPGERNYNIVMGRAKEINEFERNGFGKPYIPGSSLKGSLRTFILKIAFDRLNDSQKQALLKKVNDRRREWASEPIVKDIFGNDSNHNLMRVLEIFDAEFQEINLEKVLILSLTNEEGSSYGWKLMIKPPINVNDPEKATWIFVEALPIGSKGYSSISLSNFLLNNQIAKNELKFNEPSLSDLRTLASTINEYSRNKLKLEKQFFKELSKPKTLNALIDNIDKLITHFDDLTQDEFIMRISWGAGWKGMTGDYINDLKNDEKQKWIDFFRDKYCDGMKMKMGRPEFPIFPKTRRIVFEDDKPKYLTGWIKVKLNDTKPKDLSKSKNNKSDEPEIDPIELLKQNFKVTESKRKNK